MSDLRISSALALPLNAVTQRLAILAETGAGKTYAALVLVEELLRTGMQVVVIDPVGVCWGLRASADGKKQGLPIVVMGGDHGDLPLEPTAGRTVAELLVDLRLSVVLDLSEMSGGEQRQWLEMIRDHVACSLTVDPDDFEYVPFREKGGLGRAYALFGDRLSLLLEELNEVLLR